MHIESLERRNYFSIELVNGLVVIHGTGNDDTISIVTYPGVSKVTIGILSASGAPQQDQFGKSKVQGFEIHGRAGADNIGITWVSFQGSCEIFGNAGKDILTVETKGDDTLVGGTGDDGLHGGSGDDVLRGGSGDDNLGGNKGDDTLNGGSGTDLFGGNGGDDLLNCKDGEHDSGITGGKGNDTAKLDIGFNLDVNDDADAIESFKNFNSIESVS